MLKFLKEWFTIWGACCGALGAFLLFVWGCKVVLSAVATAWGFIAAVVVVVVIALGFAAFMTALDTRHGSDNLPPPR